MTDTYMVGIEVPPGEWPDMEPPVFYLGDALGKSRIERVVRHEFDWANDTVANFGLKLLEHKFGIWACQGWREVYISPDKSFTIFEYDFDSMYSLSDCVNWDTNQYGDCGGRVEEVDGTVICETCRNK